MKDILKEIVAHKRIELKEQKAVVSENYFNENYKENVHHSMKEALIASNTGIISEFKRKSPSKGWIFQNANPIKIISSYENAGTTAVSVLTDQMYFGGSLKDIHTVRDKINIPILRKDFIIDEYQLYQAQFVGADAVLLIAACLTKEECIKLTDKAHELDMEVLLEVHAEHELEYIQDDTDMVGVNNRNLGTFDTLIENSFKLIELLPKDKVLVSESGILNTETVLKLRKVGFKGFLIGGYLMGTSDPGTELQNFINKLK
ncbi:indole-3-glycerol phosphate synthase TrpC [Phocaeicola oris]|uniref:indole-3-glycerol phosphate synthase TrpC n=1 Tax=Phocaeicola oris TaxID=2896850 RepID=UPI00234F37BB|nr:indole-3-glycerol phosphate synthase TrpC [Phocaeicola oris]MCE2615517.1 indole-3-glycerol phosphate synthase TrpC [Phocaeicola oris]